MRIRIGVSLGIDGTTDPASLAETLAAMEALGFDSLWLAERLHAGVPDVVAGLAFAAARTNRLKLGAGVLILPGRHPARVAKQLATLDRLSGGRLLVAFGLGLHDERAAFPLPPGISRGEAFDETLVAVRRHLEDGTVGPAPVQQPLDLWVGGTADAALVRAGRLADGWLPSLVTPDEAARGRDVVEAEARRAGRVVDPEHFGVSLAYRDGPLPEPVAALAARRRPGVDPEILFPHGPSGAADAIRRFVDAGISKFVVRPAGPPRHWPAELEAMAEALLPLQT